MDASTEMTLKGYKEMTTAQTCELFIYMRWKIMNKPVVLNTPHNNKNI